MLIPPPYISAVTLQLFFPNHCLLFFYSSCFFCMISLSLSAVHFLTFFYLYAHHEVSLRVPVDIRILLLFPFRFPSFVLIQNINPLFEFFRFFSCFLSIKLFLNFEGRNLLRKTPSEFQNSSKNKAFIFALHSLQQKQQLTTRLRTNLKCIWTSSYK